MGWRERYKTASFRGVAFKVRTHETQLGRRTAVFDYPQRDEGYADDMGKRTRRYTVRALVIGEDYDKQRDALVAAFETAGPGILVHPAYGRVNVSLDGPVTISESPSQEGGKAEISATFVPAGENVSPSSSVDTKSKVGTTADAAVSASNSSFLSKFSIEGMPDFSIKSANNVLDGVLTSIDNVQRGIPSMSGIYTMAGKLTQIQSSVTNLLNTPSALASRLTSLLSGIAGLSGGDSSAAAQTAAAFISLATSVTKVDYGDYIPAVTSQREAESTNRDALVGLVQQVAVAEAVRVQTEIDYDSVDQAESMRDTLGDLIDDIADTAEDESIYLAMLRLRQAMVQDITTRGADMSKLKTITLKATLPAVVVAYQVLGDASRYDEIVARNNISHPGFVPGGVPLAVAV